MEQAYTKIATNKQTKLQQWHSIRIDSHGFKLLNKLYADVTNMEFGKAIKKSSVISLALSLVDQNHLKVLLEKNLTYEDQIERAYREHRRKNKKRIKR